MRMPPILVLAIGWLTGIFLQGWLNFPAENLFLAGGLSLLFTVGAFVYVHISKDAPGGLSLPLIGLALFVGCLGGLRLFINAPTNTPDNLIYYQSQPNVVLSGVVSDEPLYNSRSGTFRLDASQIATENSDTPIQVKGQVYVRTAASVAVEQGEAVQLVGTLEQPREITGDDFPYRDWLKRQGIYSTMDYPKIYGGEREQDFFLGRWLRQLNAATRQVVSQNVPGEEGDLLDGLLLGYKNGLDSQLRDDFTTVGLAHIIAVSGSNIAIAILLANLALSRFFTKRTVIWVTLLFILIYVLLVGANPAVLRAGIMGVMTQIGLLLGRENSGLVGLGTSAILLTVWQPEVLMDVSFQLSFMATLGLLLLLPGWHYKEQDWGKFLKQAVGTTLAAEAMILPLVIYYFHQVSLVSLLANLMVLPVIEIIMALGLVTVAAGFVPWLSWLALGAGGWCWIFLAYIVGVVRFLASLPFASLRIPLFHPIWIFLYYLVFGGLLWWLRQPEDSPVKKRVWQLSGNGLAFGTAFLVAAVIWAAVITGWVV